MKSGLLAAIAGAVSMLVLAAPAHATDLYTNDLEVDIPGPGFLANWYNYSGTGSAGETLTVTPEITASDGVGGTQSFHVGLDWSTVDMSTYWYFGMGTYAAYASDADPFALGVEGTEDPGRYQVSIDIKVEGNTFYNAEDPEVVDYVNTMPISLTVANYNDAYDTETGTDGNGDGQVNGANVFVSTFYPTLEDMGDYVTATFRLNQGEISADGSLTPTFDNTSPLFLSLNTSTGGFGMDTGNSLSLDNIKIEFLDVPPPGLDGDYNENDILDAADYTVWRDAFEVGGTIPNDPTGGIAEETDFLYWRAHFGETAGAGAGGLASSPSAVPEPTSLSLVAILGALLLGCRVKKRRIGN